MNLNKYTTFGKIEHVYENVIEKEGLFEFVNNVVMNMDMFDEHNKNGFGIMLKDLSNIYVLVANKNFPFDKLSSKHKITIDLTKTTENVVLGYIWLCPWKVNEYCVSYHFIRFIDSRIAKLNIAKYMITKYEESYQESTCLFPYEISLGARFYWKNYFTRVYGIKNKEDLDHMINDYNFKGNHINWSVLKSTLL